MRHSPLPAALATARDHRQACGVVVDHLARNPAYKPSAYLQRGTRLRCQAARTYQQVLDGIPVDAGVIGRTFSTRSVTFARDVTQVAEYLEITPRVKAEICAPVWSAGQVVGVISVESLTSLDDDALAEVETCAAALGRRLAQLGGGLPETPAQRLGRHAARLSALETRREVQCELLHAACDIASMDSAALLRASGGGTWAVLEAVGPLAPALTGTSSATLQGVAAFVDAGTSCYTVGERGGEDFPGLVALREAGAGSLVVLSLAADPRQVLVVADRTLQEVGTDLVELLEMLCAQGASALRATRLVEDLQRRAATDPLTGLGHHGAFHARLEALPAETPVAVLVIDLDHFKTVNDRFGHLAGDRLLRDVAAALLTSVRAGDELFRMGGDEFAAIVRATGEQEALEVARRVVAAVREKAGSTASVGIALSRPREALRDTLARADRALYRAKAAGRDTAALAHEAELATAAPA